MKNYSSSDKDYDLWVLFNQVRDVLFKARQKELRPHGITSTQAAVLFVIQAIGNEVTVTKISRWLLREHHSVSALLGRMEKEGLISKTKDLHTKRPPRVVLTEKGRQAYYHSAERASLHKAMGVLSEEEHQRLSSLLRQVRDEGLKELAADMNPPFP